MKLDFKFTIFWLNEYLNQIRMSQSVSVKPVPKHSDPLNQFQNDNELDRLIQISPIEADSFLRVVHRGSTKW